MYMGGALMAGWTVLLAWGAFRPIQRRGVLVMTAVPVIVGLLGANVFSLTSGVSSPGAAVSMIVMLSLLLVLFFAAWAVARQLPESS